MPSKNVLLEKTIFFTRQTLMTVGIFSLFVNLLMLTIPLYMMQLFDRVLSTYSYETLLYLTLIAGAALLVMAALDYVRSQILIYLSNWQDSELSPEALLRSPDELLRGRPYGGQSLRDITTIRQFIGGGVGIFAIFDMPWVPIYLLVVFLLHPLLGLIATIGAIFLFALALFTEKITSRELRSANEKSMVAQQYVDHSLQHAEVIQAMGMMPSLIKRWKEKNEPALALQVMASKKASMLMSFTKFFRMFLQVLMLGVGAYLVLQHQLTAGAMMAASILAARALAPVEQASGVWRQLQNARQAYTRLKQHLEEEQYRSAGIQLPTPKGELILENVTYAVPKLEKPVLANISFRLKPGEILLVMGPSGAGKSTLARLIVGAIRSHGGSVRLDGADVFTWEREAFGQHVGYLPQSIELFPGTVMENIARLKEVDDTAVIKAAQLVGLHDVILHLPQGYQTMVSDHSYTLSGGMRQRIGLARALYQNPCLIVLDEPNSYLDTEGEQALQKTIRTLREQQATQIIISHKKSLLREADYIVILANGHIQLSGPRDKVLAHLQEKMAAQSSSLQSRADTDDKK